jgi:hypothetical protein
MSDRFDRVETAEHGREPNWIASCGNMEVRALVRYQEKLSELRRLDMEVDWSSVKLQANGRRVAHWILED